MPKELEEKLTREVNKRHPGWAQERKDRYIYGTIRKAHPDWKPSHQKTLRKGG